MASKKMNISGLQQAIERDSVVLYFAPWCGFCKKFEPVYHEVSKKSQKLNSNVNVVRFNMDKHNKEVQDNNIGVNLFGTNVSQDVKGFPTVIMYKKDGQRSLYKGPRTEESLLATIAAYYRQN